MMKKMLVTFFDIKGNVLFEFIPQGQTISQAYYMYVETFNRLSEFALRKKPELCTTG
jgi:hypothetical protein